MHDHDTAQFDDPGSEKRAAMSIVADAFAEAEMAGVDCDCVVQAALFTAFRVLVDVYGEDATATYAEALPERIRSGGFTTGPRH